MPNTPQCSCQTPAPWTPQEKADVAIALANLALNIVTTGVSVLAFAISALTFLLR